MLSVLPSHRKDAAFPLPLLSGGAALVGAAVPSSFGVVLLSPLRWCCLLLIHSFANEESKVTYSEGK